MDSIYNYINELALQNPREHTINETVNSVFYNNVNIANYVEQFTHNKIVSLSRQQIFDENDIPKKVAKILVWGYPNGMRGGNLGRIINNFNLIANYCQTFSQDNDGTKFYNSLISVPGLGLSTASKILYFFNAVINNHPSVIIDSLVISAFSLFREFTALPDPTDKIQYYSNAIGIIHEITNRIHSENVININPDNVELFLFNIGKVWRSIKDNTYTFLINNSELFVNDLINNDPQLDAERLLKKVVKSRNNDI